MMRTSVYSAGLTNPSTRWLRTMLTGAAVAIAMTSPAAADPEGPVVVSYTEECKLAVLPLKKSLLTFRECEGVREGDDGQVEKGQVKK